MVDLVGNPEVFHKLTSGSLPLTLADLAVIIPCRSEHVHVNESFRAPSVGCSATSAKIAGDLLAEPSVVAEVHCRFLHPASAIAYGAVPSAVFVRVVSYAAAGFAPYGLVAMTMDGSVLMGEGR